MHTVVLDPQHPLLPKQAPTVDLLICLLGGFRVLCHGQPLDLLAEGKSRIFLAELALRLESGVPREEMLETLWPEQDAPHASVSLNSLVYSLQRRLRGVSQVPMVVYMHGCYILNTSAGVGVDVAQFNEYVDRGMQLVAAGREGAAAHAFEHAVNLYRGDLGTDTSIAGIIERERLRARFLTVLAWLADWAYRTGADAPALRFALRLLAKDPCREDAHRLIMRIHVRRGERAQAFRQYQVCEQVLRREFEAVPEVLTRELFDQIRRDPDTV